MDLLLELREDFIETKIKPILLPKAIEEIHKEMETNKVIIATATNNFVTRPIATLFGVDDLIATDFEIIDNEFTGKVDGIPCFRDGKLTKVEQWSKNNDYDLNGSKFYSDSFNDIPLLQKVSEAIVVDGDEKLLQEAKNYGWKCVSFR